MLGAVLEMLELSVLLTNRPATNAKRIPTAVVFVLPCTPLPPSPTQDLAQQDSRKDRPTKTKMAFSHLQGDGRARVRHDAMTTTSKDLTYRGSESYLPGVAKRCGDRQGLRDVFRATKTSMINRNGGTGPGKTTLAKKKPTHTRKHTLTQKESTGHARKIMLETAAGGYLLVSTNSSISLTSCATFVIKGGDRNPRRQEG